MTLHGCWLQSDSARVSLDLHYVALQPFLIVPSKFERTVFFGWFCMVLEAQKPEAGLSKRQSVRRIATAKSRAQREEEAAASLATMVWDMTDRCAPCIYPVAELHSSNLRHESNWRRYSTGCGPCRMGSEVVEVAIGVSAVVVVFVAMALVLYVS